MSETARNSTNTVVIVLVVAVVVLAAVLGYSIWNNSNKVPAVSDVSPGAGTAAAGAGAAAGSGAAGAGTAMGGTTAAAPVAFDPKTATKVPAGTTPLAFVKAYHEAVVKGQYEQAYKMLPLDKQKSYGDAAGYAAQVKAYGITKYELGTPTESGDTFTVAGTQVTPQMPITYTWTLKKVGDQWFVASRTMGGS
jgi:hypothetical protein